MAEASDGVTVENLSLYGSDERSHEAAGGPAAFDETLVAVSRARRAGAPWALPVPIRQRTLGRLHRTFNLALALAGHPGRSLAQPFEPRPVATLGRNLARYTETLRRLSEGTAIEVDGPDENLVALVTRFEAVADGANEAELLRLLGMLTDGVYVGPRTFHLDLANSCNENCSYCWFHSPASKDRPDAAQFDSKWKRTQLDHQTALKLIDDLARMDAREDLLLTGKGEPLTHPRCLDILEHAKARGLAVTLFTNGVLVTPPAAARMVGAGLDMLYVSLSAASRGTYEALHPGHDGAELELVKSNLLDLAARKADGGTRAPDVVMVDVVCHDNARELADFARWSADVGASFLRYQLVHVQSYNKHLMLTAEDLEHVRAGLVEAKAIAHAAGLRVMSNIDWQLETLEPATGAWGGTKAPEGGCTAGWTFSRVWADGTLSFCCSPKPIANLTGQSFETIWKGELYDYYRTSGRRFEQSRDVKFIDGTPLVNDHCFSCPNYEGLVEARQRLRAYGLEAWAAAGA